MDIDHQRGSLQQLIDALDSCSYAAKGVTYIKSKFPKTKDLDADSMFRYVQSIMSDPAKVNTLVMESDPVLLSSITHFVSWYAQFAHSNLIPTAVTAIYTARLESLPNMLDDIDGLPSVDI